MDDLSDLDDLIERATDAVLHRDESICFSLMPEMIQAVRDYRLVSGHLDRIADKLEEIRG